MDLDLIVTNGTIVTASEVLETGLQIGVKDGKIVAIATSLTPTPQTKVFDAQGAYITPGGIDTHVHLSQANIPAGDTWETGTRSAVAGGTTTIIAFASQEKNELSLFPLLEDYHSKARGQSYVDYGFHFILTNPSKEILKHELPIMVSKEGITSVKLYMTYEPLKLSDRELLDIMMTTRELGMTTMVHCENSDMIALITERLEERGLTDPYYHAVSRPQIAENEASYRAIALAELVDAPILLVHVSSEVSMQTVREAQTRMLPIHAETCPQYLFLLSERMEGKEFEGAKYVCSPPLKHEKEDLAALWQGVANGTFTTFSSDHSPSKFYEEGKGKRLGIVDGIPIFARIPNGLPGVETRVPLLFSEACGPDAKLTLPRFVLITAAHPAKLYGLQGIKGNIAPGYDADFVIWYPSSHLENGVEISQDMMHHSVDYTPYEGMRVKNWPRYTFLRGELVWDRDDGGVLGKLGSGRFLKRKRGELVVGRTGNRVSGMKPGERSLWT